MRIPKKIKIHGVEYIIKRVDMSDRGEWGKCHPDKRLLELTKAHKHISREAIEQTLLHECVHACFHEMGEDKLFSNEKVVDAIASLMQELFKQLREKK